MVSRRRWTKPPRIKYLAMEPGVALVRAIMQEVILAAAADGITVSPAARIETQITRTRSMGAYFTSSHIDRRNGRALEINALFALPLEAAKREWGCGAESGDIVSGAVHCGSFALKATCGRRRRSADVRRRRGPL